MGREAKVIGLDTTAIIDIFKGNRNIRRKLKNIEEPKVVTQLSYLELLFGLDRTLKKHKIEEMFYDDFFGSLRILPLDRKACKKASDIHWNLKSRGKMIGRFDCTIAGIFLANDIKKIITKNKKHFQQISTLNIITY